MEFNDLRTQQVRLKDQISAAIARVLDHGQFIMGPEVRELEQKLADYTGAKHCISCGNGTDALMMALMALDLKPDDEIITSPFSFLATSEVAAILNIIPVFVDIEANSFNINPSLIEAAISPRTKAIIPVSLYGLCSEMDTINSIAHRHGLAVIEDGAQSFGATYKNKRSGNLSHIGTTSFFPSKPLGCYGDGGAIFTSDDELAQKLRQIRVHGQSKRYHQAIIGINSRLDSIQAAILLTKLEVFEDEIVMRNQVAARYQELLGEMVVLPSIPHQDTHVFAQYTIRSPQRDRLMMHLKDQGIPSAVYYPILLNEQEAMVGRCRVVGGLEEARQASLEALSLPMHPYLKHDEQLQVAHVVCDSLMSFNHSPGEARPN